MKLTPADTSKFFLEWREEMAGDGEESNMMKLDAAVGDLQARQKEREEQGFTWGMLRGSGGV